MQCEWSNIVGFVSQFNDTHGTAYTHSACLDVANRARKEPEVLLEATGEPPMVVERKSVGTGDHFYNHGNEHFFAQTVQAGLRNRRNFNDDLYVVEVRDTYLAGKSQRAVREIAEQVTSQILSGVFVGDGWSLHRTFPDDDQPCYGLMFEFSGGWHRNVATDHEKTTQMKSQYTESFQRVSQDAAEKFIRYDDCLRILLVEFYGYPTISVDVTDEDIRAIIRSSALPAQIDQVWAAKVQWVGLNDSIIVWERVR